MALSIRLTELTRCSRNRAGSSARHCPAMSAMSRIPPLSAFDGQSWFGSRQPRVRRRCQITSLAWSARELLGCRANNRSGLMSLTAYRRRGASGTCSMEGAAALQPVSLGLSRLTTAALSHPTMFPNYKAMQRILPHCVFIGCARPAVPTFRIGRVSLIE